MGLESSNFEANTGGGGTRSPGTVPPLASSSHLDGGTLGHRARTTYLWYVLAHPANLLFLGSFLLASVVSASLGMFVCTLLLEAMVLAGLPQMAWLQRSLDRQLRGRERREAAAVRSALSADMTPERRGELVELEHRVETIRTNAERARSRGDALLDDLVGLDRLLGSFTRLAVMQCATGESLEMTDRDELVSQIGILEQQLRVSTSIRLREAIARRLGLARRRLEAFDRNRQRVLAMDHQLSTIAEMIRLVHEQSVALMDASNTADIVERVMFELEQHEQALHEIVAVCVPDDPPAEVVEPVAAEEPAPVRRARVVS